MKSKKWKNKNFWVALLHSLNGIKNAFLIEKNMKIQRIFQKIEKDCEKTDKSI